jgi:hypothetical protein
MSLSTQNEELRVMSAKNKQEAENENKAMFY